MSLDILQNCHPALRHRVVELAFADAGLSMDIGRSHIEMADEVITTGRTGAGVDFPHGYALTISYGRVLARKKAEFQKKRDGEDGYVTGHAGAIADEEAARTAWADGKTPDSLPGYCLLQIEDDLVDFENFDDMVVRKVKTIMITGPLRSIEIKLITDVEGKLPVVLRTRRDGDFIRLRGSNSALITKKIQDFFTDARIPAHMRDDIPMLCLGREVLLILGDEITGQRTGLAKSRYTAAYR